jgi:hypothetical protein
VQLSISAGEPVPGRAMCCKQESPRLAVRVAACSLLHPVVLHATALLCSADAICLRHIYPFSKHFPLCMRVLPGVAHVHILNIVMPKVDGSQRC